MALPVLPDRVVRFVTRAYQSFLVMYPAVFRAKYGPEMKVLFEERCSELYETAGTVEIGRWMLKILVGEVINIYKEHLDTMIETIQSSQDVRRAVGLGIIFLGGTWIALFFLATRPVWPLVDRITGSDTEFVAGAVLVLANAVLVTRSLIRSERLEYVAGMVAMANTFLIAGVLAVQAGLGSLHNGLAVLVQGVLIVLHGQLLWRLRGDDLIHNLQEVEVGG